MEKRDDTKVEEVIKLSELMPILEDEADFRKLNIYVFDNTEIKKYFEAKSEDLGIVLLAKDEDNAFYNLRNLRRCYLVRYKE